MAKPPTTTAARFERIAAGIERVLDLLLAAMLAGMVFAMFYQVFGRYVIGRAPSWSEELARMLIVWMTMLGSAAALRAGAHITVTVLLDALPRGWRAPMLALRDAAVVAAAGVLVLWGIDFAGLMHVKASPAFEIPMSWVYAAMPVGAGLIVLMVFLARLAGKPFPGSGGEIF